MSSAMRIRKIYSSTRETVNILEGVAFGTTTITAMAVSPSGTVYVADSANHVIRKVFDYGQAVSATVGHIGATGDTNATGIGSSTANTARLNADVSLCIDKSGVIYVGNGDGTGFDIKRVYQSAVSLFAGNYNYAGNVVGNVGSDARFSYSALGMGMEMDRAGLLYIADTGNNRIKRFWPSGKSGVMAGGASGMANGEGNSAQFSAPRDVSIDNNGNVYVADTGNNRIRKITDSGLVSTVAGYGTAGSADGAGMSATFNAPSRICVEPNGRFLYVLDNGTGLIRRVNEYGQVNTFGAYAVPAGSVGDICCDNSGYIYVLEA